jgi:D-amino-acid oxidase
VVALAAPGSVGSVIESPVDVLVIGAGVSGLTTAVRLAEAGLRVRVHTAQPSDETTSAAAGAMWGPYLVEPRDKVRRWGLATLNTLRELAEVPGTGVRIVAGIEASRTPADPPDWADLLDEMRPCSTSELPMGFVCGWRFAAPMIDMSVYLRYLASRLRRAGGQIVARTERSLRDALPSAPMVVNCAGIGARELVPDPGLTAIRGQLVVIDNPGIDEFFSEDTGVSPDLLHIYPQGDLVVVGGTAESGSYDLVPDQQTAEQILRRCAAIEPRLRDARIRELRVGLRPTRAAIRVEEAPCDQGRLFHNYGHGGAGVSLSWGCAEDITARITAGCA